MMDAVLDTSFGPGDPLYYRSADGGRVLIVGRVVAVEAPRRFSHTQQLLVRDDPPTLVTWELDEVEGGTRVTLRHSGWPAETEDLDKVDAIWAVVLPELKRLVGNDNRIAGPDSQQCIGSGRGGRGSGGYRQR